MKDRDLDLISSLSGLSPVSCSCAACQSMCKKAPCLGTPDDIAAIVKAGYINRVVDTTWAAGRDAGLPPIQMIQPLYDEEKQSCTFFSNGLCELHERGLKPTEGKLANCKISSIAADKIPPSYAVAIQWMAKYNKRKIKKLATALFEKRIELFDEMMIEFTKNFVKERDSKDTKQSIEQQEK